MIPFSSIHGKKVIRFCNNHSWSAATGDCKGAPETRQILSGRLHLFHAIDKFKVLTSMCKTSFRQHTHQYKFKMVLLSLQFLLLAEWLLYNLKSYHVHLSSCGWFCSGINCSQLQFSVIKTGVPAKNQLR